MVGKLFTRLGLMAALILVLPLPSWSADSDGPPNLREIKKEIRYLAVDRQRALEKRSDRAL